MIRIYWVWFIKRYSQAEAGLAFGGIVGKVWWVTWLCLDDYPATLAKIWTTQAVPGPPLQQPGKRGLQLLQTTALEPAQNCNSSWLGVKRDLEVGHFLHSFSWEVRPSNPVPSQHAADPPIPEEGRMISACCYYECEYGLSEEAHLYRGKRTCTWFRLWIFKISL